MTTFIRVGLTILLLALVWHYAHWSVAITLTLICAANEFTSKHFNRDRKYRAERNLVEYRLFKKIKNVANRLEQAEKQIQYANRIAQQSAAKQPAAAKEILRPKSNG